MNRGTPPEHLSQVGWGSGRQLLGPGGGGVLFTARRLKQEASEEGWRIVESRERTSTQEAWAIPASRL